MATAIGLLCDICDEKVTDNEHVTFWSTDSLLAVFHMTCWVSANRWAGKMARRQSIPNTPGEMKDA